MEKKIADYISRIEIESMWGRKHIVWNLRPDVNVLSGVNGVGKSTIINKTIDKLDYMDGGEIGNDTDLGVNFVFSPSTSPKCAAKEYMLSTLLYSTKH